MSIYKELNDFQLDVSKYENEPLTEIEQKQWERRVLKKLRIRKKSHSKKWVGLTAAFVLVIGVIIPFGGVSFREYAIYGRTNRTIL